MRLGVVQVRVDESLHASPAVLGRERAQTAGAHVTGGELRAQVAQNLLGHPHVALDEPPYGFDRAAFAHEPHRRQAQPFLIELSGVAAVAPGGLAAYVCVMGDGHHVAQQPGAFKHRLRYVDVRQVRPALVRIV